MADTAKNWPISKAPKYTQLFGDKTKKIESATHIIEFPGGAIEVSRTTDGNYWAHIIVNDQPAFADGSTRQSARGIVINSRLGRSTGVTDFTSGDDIHQLAVLIKPVA